MSDQADTPPTETEADTPDAPADSPPRKRPILWIALAGIAAVLALGLWLASRPPAQQLQGEVQADEVNVATKLLSRADRLLVDAGDRVSAGQTLAILSSPEIDNGEVQAQAALRSAQELQSLAIEGPREENIQSLHATWQAAAATAQLAATTSQRADRLFAEGVISAQRRDEARAARTSTARIAEASRAQYDRARAGTREQNQAIAAAQVDAARAAVDTAAALQNETRLIAPIAGEVSRRLAQPGEIVSPVLPVFQILDIDHPWVALNVQESQYSGLAKGKVLIGKVPALNRKVRFRVQSISPQGGFATWRATRQSSGYDVRAFEVKLAPAAATRDLRPGMSVLFDWPQ